MVQEKLKILRKQRGLSQEKMAKILSTDPSNYSRKERGEIGIHDEEWQKLADALEVSVKDIKNNETKFSFQSFNDYPKRNITFSNIPDFFLEIQKKYIEKLEKENYDLLEQIKLLKSKQKQINNAQQNKLKMTKDMFYCDRLKNTINTK